MTLALPSAAALPARPRRAPRRQHCALVHCVPGRARIRILRTELLEQAEALQRWLRAQPGVCAARVSARSASAVVRYEAEQLRPEALLDRLEALTPAALQEAGADAAAADSADASANTLGPLLLSGSAAALGLFGAPALVPYLLGAAALPIFGRAFASVARERRLGVDVLDAAATCVLGAQRQFTTAAAMVALISLGEHLRELTRQRSLRALASLYEHDAQFAWRVVNGDKQRVPVAQIAPGDEIAIYPGEIAPLDGVVYRGEALLDQRHLTGEATPVHKRVDDEIYAGSVVTEGRIYVRAARVGTRTRAAEILRLVHSAPVGETRSLDYASRFADRLVPWSLAGAGVLAAAGATAQTCAALLIADFGTGMRVAGPTTVLAAMTAAARSGVLIKGGRQLELLAHVDAVVFDKTGTLTTGVPEVTDVLAYAKASPEELLGLAAAAEQRFTHPAAKAVVRAALARGLQLARRADTEYCIGQGVSTRIGARIVLVGSARFLASRGVDTRGARADLHRAERSAASQLLVALDGRLAGLLLYRDQPRDDAAQLVRALRERGIREIVMLTGDHALAARSVSAHLGITRTIADASPPQKAALVEELRSAGRTVAVVGDGINDSPALAVADVGISLASATDLAQQTAGVVLLRERLGDIAGAIDLARAALARIDQSWSFNRSANCGAIALSLVGLSGPVLATAISNGAALLSALRGMRPLPDRTSDGGIEPPIRAL